MTEDGGLEARIRDLERTDRAIAEAARAADPSALARAIEARAPVAADVIEMIALEDQDLSARMAAAEVRPGGGARFAERIARRDREMEALSRLVESRTHEYRRLLRQLEDDPE